MAPWIFVGGVLLVGTIVGIGTAFFILATTGDGDEHDGQSGTY
jgi:hypothetical protein